MVSRYQKRISGPLLDRIDIHVEVPRVDYEKLSAGLSPGAETGTHHCRSGRLPSLLRRRPRLPLRRHRL
jgi:hypothetical protein